jgi:hypothetical protein
MTINLTSEVKIYKASIGDIPALVALNTKWFKDNLKNTQNGFLSVCYTHAMFERMILNNDILVFYVNRVLSGYVLVNTVFSLPHTETIQHQLFEKMPEFINKKIAYSYQIILDTAIQGTGFFSLAQYACREFFKNQYDLLVSTIQKTNGRSVNAHAQLGWTILDTPNPYYLIAYPLK